MTTKYKLIIFDWDGTLMDSELKIVRCFQQACTDVGQLVPGRNQIKEIIGLDLATSLRHLLPHANDRDCQRVISRYRDYFLHLDKTQMEFFPKVLTGLGQLEIWGYGLAIATGKARRGLDRLLDQWKLHHHFISTRCADEAYSKPNPRMLLDILEHTGLGSSEAIMVGDTVFDMEMATHANMDRLAVSYGMHDRHRLISHNPISCFDDFSQLLDWFDPRNVI